MKAKDLAKRLMENPEMDIMILDGMNGGGVPRTINFGPIEHIITKQEDIETYDCDGKAGSKVLLIGFGSY